MADRSKKEIKMACSMGVVIEGKGLVLKESFLNLIKNVSGEQRMNNIHNRKKVKIEEDNESGQE